MAIKQGWDGAVFLGSTSASSEAISMNSWTINWAGDALENTDFGNKDRTYQPGLRNVTVDFAGYYESTNTAQKYLVDSMEGAATIRKVYVKCLTKRTAVVTGWAGAGPLTALTVGGSVDGLVPISGSVQISGGLSTV
jgi:hypothetical protein